MPNDPDGWVRLGYNTYLLDGREGEAAAYFERAVTLDPAVFDDNEIGRKAWEKAIALGGEPKPATVAKREGGHPLLPGNPFRGYPVPGEQSINQPITSDREIAAMRGIADQVDPLYRLYFELTYWTGHRRMAVGRLRWSDFDLESGTVCWTAQHDKTGFEHVVPLDETVAELMRAQCRRAPVMRDTWLSPSPTDRDKPISRNLARDWWKRLEKAAGLRHVKGRGWHSLRRRFATDLDHLPMKQLMDLAWWMANAGFRGTLPEAHHRTAACRPEDPSAASLGA